MIFFVLCLLCVFLQLPFNFAFRLTTPQQLLLLSRQQHPCLDLLIAPQPKLTTTPTAESVVVQQFKAKGAAAEGEEDIILATTAATEQQQQQQQPPPTAATPASITLTTTATVAQGDSATAAAEASTLSTESAAAESVGCVVGKSLELSSLYDLLKKYPRSCYSKTGIDSKQPVAAADSEGHQTPPTAQVSGLHHASEAAIGKVADVVSKHDMRLKPEAVGAADDCLEIALHGDIPARRLLLEAYKDPAAPPAALLASALHALGPEQPHCMHRDEEDPPVVFECEGCGLRFSDCAAAVTHERLCLPGAHSLKKPPDQGGNGPTPEANEDEEDALQWLLQTAAAASDLPTSPHQQQQQPEEEEEQAGSRDALWGGNSAQEPASSVPHELLSLEGPQGCAGRRLGSQFYRRLTLGSSVSWDRGFRFFPRRGEAAAEAAERALNFACGSRSSGAASSYSEANWSDTQDVVSLSSRLGVASGLNPVACEIERKPQKSIHLPTASPAFALEHAASWSERETSETEWRIYRFGKHLPTASPAFALEHAASWGERETSETEWRIYRFGKSGGSRIMLMEATDGESGEGTTIRCSAGKQILHNGQRAAAAGQDGRPRCRPFLSLEQEKDCRNSNSQERGTAAPLFFVAIVSDGSATSIAAPNARRTARGCRYSSSVGLPTLQQEQHEALPAAELLLALEMQHLPVLLEPVLEANRKEQRSLLALCFVCCDLPPPVKLHSLAATPLQPSATSPA
ncbi:16S rRNA processing protein RimM, putative [Eimeria praecox]|uniref:16S rRNA processing protein RimM, putative n=1 Tax=Eimeria praecox TaxID=51316 RepID=U6H395_9EIME|nr:16S rRNA processing protein RimM, putative [Eimeria praecox]